MALLALIKKISLNLLWVITYPFAVFKSARIYGGMNDRLAKRPRIWITSFVWAMFSFQVAWFLVRYLAPAQLTAIPQTVMGLMAVGWLVGWLASKLQKSPVRSAPAEIFGSAVFLAGVVSLLLWAIF